MDGKFDLKRLAALNEFELDSLADQDESLTVAEYFDRLEYFLQKTPFFLDSFRNLRNVSNKPAFLEELEELKKLLYILGSTRLSKEIPELIAVVQDGQDTRLRNRLIVQITEALDEMLERTGNTYLSDQSDMLPDERLIGKKKGGMSDYIHAAAQKMARAHGGSDISLKLALEELNTEAKPKILAVDDMPDVLSLVKAALGKKYKVFTLTKTEQVNRFLEKHTPDLFLLDIEMPGIDGYALTYLIREHEKHRETPIVFLSSNASMEYINTAIKLGADGFVRKPIDKETLLQKVDSYFASAEEAEV